MIYSTSLGCRPNRGVFVRSNVARFVASQKDQEEPEAPGEGVANSQHWRCHGFFLEVNVKGVLKSWEVAEFWMEIKIPMVF